MTGQPQAAGGLRPLHEGFSLRQDGKNGSLLNRSARAVLATPPSAGAEARLRYVSVGVPGTRIQSLGSREAPVTVLREFWPLFILSRIGEEGCQGKRMLELLCPPSPVGLRMTYRPVFIDVDPTAAAGLDATPDEELGYWVKVLRAPLFTGQPGEATFTPEWLTVDGLFLADLARLLTLPLYERMDVFMAAMHQRGAA